ncbi:unnamed protein product [Lymnaea stagnalis]|uniref:Serpin domain-containing protein n=1 Tax=Lymnaea stagnalis TaxID=6523 RepID=A0AAV2IHL4_LYMST
MAGKTQVLLSKLLNMTEAAAANNKFGLDLFKTIYDGSKGKNNFLSPFSISVALAMTQLGARETTAQAMAKTLRWETADETKIHKQFQAYLKLLQKPSDAYQLSTGNRIYLEQSYPILDEFKSQTQEWYLAEPVNADFINNADQERTNINTWVAEQTQKKIKDLLPPGILNALTRMVLVNAVYFKGKWHMQFNDKNTRPSPFKIAPGETKDVPMMSLTSVFPFAHDEELKFTAVELPYQGKELGMVIILPDEDFGLQELVQKLTWEKLSKLFENLGKPGLKIQLTMPKFEITDSFDLKSTLVSLGMGEAFDESEKSANFSGMTTKPELYLSAVIHKAYVKVNEEGTEAAAATGAVMMMRCAMPLPPPTVKVDHPFLFLIRDLRAESSILFLGQISDPSI